jgi:DNA-binding transcriptional LysR family regulator
VARRAGVTDFAIFGSPAYLERRGRPSALADLAEHACVLFRGHGGRTTWSLTGPNGEESIDVTGPISVDHMAFVARAAVAGIGLALLPIPLALGSAPDGELEVVLPDYRMPGAALSVVLPSSAYVPARIALLRDFLVERLSEHFALATRTCQKHLRPASPSAAVKGSFGRGGKRRGRRRRAS